MESPAAAVVPVPVDGMMKVLMEENSKLNTINHKTIKRSPQ
jgi:hypothetical protein